MQKATIAILLRIFIGESDRYKGHVLYQYILTYLRKNHYAGATVIRAISGFGRDTSSTRPISSTSLPTCQLSSRSSIQKKRSKR